MSEKLLVTIIQCLAIFVFGVWFMYMTHSWRQVAFPAIHGRINQKKERKWLLKDLMRAQEKIFFVVGRGCFEFWKDKKVIQKIREAAGRGVIIELIVGESHFEALQELAKEGIIKLHILMEEPQNTLWLFNDIYGYGTYTANHNKGYYLWTRTKWRKEVACKQEELIMSYFDKFVLTI